MANSHDQMLYDSAIKSAKRGQYEHAISTLNKMGDKQRASAVIKKLEARIRKRDTEAELSEAKALIREGRYEQARAMLITMDGTEADALLQRLTDIAPVRARKAHSADKSFTMHLVISFVLLWFALIPGLIATTVFSREARHYPDAPGAKALKYLNWLAWGLFVVFAACGALTAITLYTVNANDLFVYSQF